MTEPAAFAREAPEGAEPVQAPAVQGAPRSQANGRPVQPDARLTVAPAVLADALLLAAGAYAPLSGFMDAEDHASVCATLRLAGGAPWPLPIAVTVGRQAAKRLGPGAAVALCRARRQAPVARLEVTEVYRISRRETARAVFGTLDRTHPGVKRLLAQSPHRLAGTVQLLDPLAAQATPAPGLPATPEETRLLIAARGWQTVVGFQTRNPLHRAHEYIMKSALETVDGLLLHPLVGTTRPGDWPAELRLEVYRVVVGNYFPAQRVVLGLFPAAMRYAGPREALFHALVRRNYGCTHFVVGRDHAGVGAFYSPFAAQEIFTDFTPEELGIQPLCFDHAFYCRRCEGMATGKTCPHGDAARLAPSGSRIRQLLAQGREVPREVSRPEVTAILRTHR